MTTTTGYKISTPRHRELRDSPPIAPTTTEEEADGEEAALRRAPAIVPVESPGPRTFSQIKAAREATTTVPPAVQQAIPSWLPITLAIGLGLLVIILVALFSYNPAAQNDATMVATSMAQNATSIATATLNPLDPSIPLRERYAIGGAAQPVATSASGTGTSEISSGDASLEVEPDGTMVISIDVNTSCIPVWSSPPPSWQAENVKTNFTKERNGCLPIHSELRASGWYGKTNWVQFIRAKPGTSGNTADTVDIVWADVTWFGHAIDDIYSLPEAKSGVIKDLEPPPSPTPGPPTVVPTDIPAPAPVYQPPLPTEPPPVYIAPTEPPPPPPPTATEPRGGTKPSPSKPTARPAENVKSSTR